MHLITPKYVYPQKVICTPKCLTQGVHVPLNQNVSGNAGVLNDAFAILFSDFLYNNICCGYLFELPRLVEAIQMSSHNICFYKEVDKDTLTVI